MIVGHIGVALGARALKPDAPLGWLIGASFAPDLIDAAVPAIENCREPGLHSHSWPAIALIVALLALAARWSRNDWRLSGIVAILVVVHVLTDYITGAKVLWVGGPIVGLELYDWPRVDFVLETLAIGTGWLMLRRSGTGPGWARSRTLLAALVVIQAAADLEVAQVRSRRVNPCTSVTRAPRDVRGIASR
jgi:hypothetical protein